MEFRMSKSKKKVSAKEFDEDFDKGRDMSKYLDFKEMKAHYPIQRVNVDIPQQMLRQVDQEAARVGVPRTSLIKIWIAERLQHLTA